MVLDFFLNFIKKKVVVTKFDMETVCITFPFLLPCILFSSVYCVLSFIFPYLSTTTDPILPHDPTLLSQNPIQAPHTRPLWRRVATIHNPLPSWPQLQPRSFLPWRRQITRQNRLRVSRQRHHNRSNKLFCNGNRERNHELCVDGFFGGFMTNGFGEFQWIYRNYNFLRVTMDL